jgi:FKBP-type peptidyl-prolyl cis-trans isomerase
MKTPLITGFNEAISMMNKGADIDFIMPSKLAYGSTGAYEIEPYTPLGFNIKMRYIGKAR